MDYKRFLGSIFLVVFLLVTHAVQGGNGDDANALRNQLIEGAQLFGLKIVESKIEIADSEGEGNDGTVAYVPLLDNVTTTDEEIATGEVYTGFQCMDTEKLKGCFKVRLSGGSENEADFELVDKEGKTVAKSRITIRPGTVNGRPCIHVWINGVYMGCFDRVIIILRVVRTD